MTPDSNNPCALASAPTRRWCCQLAAAVCLAALSACGGGTCPADFPVTCDDYCCDADHPYCCGDNQCGSTAECGGGMVVRQRRRLPNRHDRAGTQAARYGGTIAGK